VRRKPGRWPLLAALLAAAALAVIIVLTVGAHGHGCPSAQAAPYRVTLDSAAFFLPNSTQFVTGESQVLAGLQPVIRAWRTGDYSRVTVVGHCAMFGPPQGALALSRARAMLIAAMLRRGGVSNITATGVGYGQPLPPSPQSASNRVVVVTVYPKN
jgi:outer membrane protein OmpA-like peptidoglycan-associated protein